MKTLPYILLIAASLAILRRSVAQDAPTRPLREPFVESSPSASPTPSESPTPIPHETTSTPRKAPVAAPDIPPRESEQQGAAKPENTSVAIQATPATATQKSSAKIEAKPLPDAATKPTPETKALSSEEQGLVAEELKAMEKEWEAGFNDAGVIQKALADDFVGTSPVGEVVSKKSLIRDAKKAKGSALSSAAHHLDVHFYGPNLAVVIGAAKETGKNKVQHNYRFTDTWVERDGKWQCVASQATLLPRK